MSALLTPRGLALALFVFAMVGRSQAQLLVDELTVPSEKGVGSFEVWANQRSNALSSGFLHTFQQGGFLERAFYDRRSRNRLLRTISFQSRLSSRT